MYGSNEKYPIAEVLPEQYTFPRLKEFPRKSQESNQLCWAYASMGCVEFKLVQEDCSLNPKRLNFSRVHMRYSCFDNFTTEQRSWGINANISGGPKINQFRPCIEAYFSRHSGPVYEFAEPTPSDSKLEARSFEEIEENPIKPYFVSDLGAVNPNMETGRRIEDVKRAVMNHGAVFANIQYNVDYLKDNLYYAMTEKGSSGKEAGYHAVMIVGWDDTIEKSCFYNSNKLKRNGAFLIRDSSIQGPVSMNKNYWISYDDVYLLEINCFVKSVDRWYDEFRMYQNNYFGTFMARSLRGICNSEVICFLVNYKRESHTEKEVIRSVLLSNATVETVANVVLVRSNGVEENLISDLCMEEIGYGTYPVKTDVFLESGEENFSLKVTYSRNAKFEIPMELSSSQREAMAKRAKGIEEKEQFLCIDGQFHDVTETRISGAVGRGGIKLITEPADEKWHQLKKYVDDYVVQDILSPVPHNVKTDAKFSVSWEALREDNGKIIAGIHVIQDTLINETSEDTDFVLHGKFTVRGNGQKVYRINRYYYTRLPKGQLTVEPIQSPKAGEYQFTVKGQSPYPNTAVQIVGYEVKNKTLSGKNSNDILLGSGSSDDNGVFKITCSYFGEGTLLVTAKTLKMESEGRYVVFFKDYTEEEGEEETGSGTKTKVINYYPDSGIGFGQILRVIAAGALIYEGYKLYVYCARHMRITRAMLPEDEIPLLNIHFRHLHTDVIQEDEKESGTIFFENDVSGVRRIFKSLENSSIEGITFSMPGGMGLIGVMDKNSVIKDSRFIIRDEGSCNYFSMIDKVNGGHLEKIQFLVSVMKDKAESFPGFAEDCEDGRVENCVCRLLNSQDVSAMQVNNDFAGLLGSSHNTEISECTFEGNVKAGGNVSGIVGNAVKTIVSSCYVNASLEGQSVSGITAYAVSQLAVCKCMAEGRLVAVNSAGAICAVFRSYDTDMKSSIENCICRMDIRVQEAEKGMIGYAGGIAGIGGNQECGLQIENCLVLGTVSCGMDSWIAGIAASAKSCKNTVAALTGISAAHTSAQVSVFGDCSVENCLSYNQIETMDGYFEGAGRVDGQILARKNTYIKLGWDFENIWNFSENGFPYLRNMEGKISEWPFPFIRLNGLQEDGSLNFKANTQISFSGIYGKEMKGISFQSCILQGDQQQIPMVANTGDLQKPEKFILNFGMLSEVGTYQFTLKYSRGERTHTVTLPVRITENV